MMEHSTPPGENVWVKMLAHDYMYMHINTLHDVCVFVAMDRQGSGVFGDKF